jgi:acyl dehydratase
VPQRTVLDFRRRPSALRYMALAFWPSSGVRAGEPFPDLVARWHGVRATAPQLADFAALCGPESGEALPFLFPHALGFRLHMALLTHPAFPVPIWRVLQIRNRITEHRRVARDAALDLELRVAGHRVLERGLEVDLHGCAREAGEIVWESVNTFYVRGRFGPAGAASPFAAAPAVDASAPERWTIDRGGALRFGALTGDYNGIHLADRYARLFGFPRAFLHPQRVLGRCLARLSMPCGAPLRLDTWLKGPVPYGAEVTLRASSREDEIVFALSVEKDERPAIVGRLYTGEARAGAAGPGSETLTEA